MRTLHFILRMEIPHMEDTIPLFYLALMAINSDTFLNGFLLFALMQVCVILLSYEFFHRDSEKLKDLLLIFASKFLQQDFS